MWLGIGVAASLVTCAVVKFVFMTKKKDTPDKNKGKKSIDAPVKKKGKKNKEVHFKKKGKKKK